MARSGPRNGNGSLNGINWTQVAVGLASALGVVLGIANTVVSSTSKVSTEVDRLIADVAYLQAHNADQDKDIIRTTAHQADIDRRLDVFSRFVERLDINDRDSLVRRIGDMRAEIENLRHELEESRRGAPSTSPPGKSDK